MPYDYSTAPPPRDFELVPAGTLASVLMRIRPGGAGEDGMLKRSKDGACEMLDCEFVVVDGPYSRRKFWTNLVLEGTTAGHAQAAEISRGILRNILESARNIRPDDMSDQARARRMASLKDFDNIPFLARIGIEKGRPKNDGGENYPDKNVIASVITPDKKEWHPVEQPPPFNGGNAGATASPSSPPSATPASGITKPSWAS
jgi:hypothetical protein